MLIDLGANEHQFILAAKKGLNDPESKKYFEQLIACENFLYFKNMMVKKNIELQSHAYNLFKQDFAKNVGANIHELNKLENNDLKFKKEQEKKEKEEYEALIEMSKALEKVKCELNAKEEEEFKKALQLSEEMHKRNMAELDNDIQLAIRLSQEQSDNDNKLSSDNDLKQAIHMSLQEKERAELKLKNEKKQTASTSEKTEEISLYNNNLSDGIID